MKSFHALHAIIKFVTFVRKLIESRHCAFWLMLKRKIFFPPITTDVKRKSFSSCSTLVKYSLNNNIIVDIYIRFYPYLKGKIRVPVKSFQRIFKKTFLMHF